MKTEKRLIDANALLKKWRISHLYYKLKLYIDKAPTIDAVEVVRCKDCKHYKEHEKRCDHPCQEAEHCYDCWLETEPTDFCSCGERRASEIQESQSL